MDTSLDLRNIELPRVLMVNGKDVARDLLDFTDDTVAAWTGRWLSPRHGYGLVTTQVVPVGTFREAWWDDPQAFVAFGIAAHGASPHYPWNGARKLGMLGRSLSAGYDVSSSLELVRRFPHFARNIISAEAREIERAGGFIGWGDFPYGGAVRVTDGTNEVGVGTSVWEQQEDHRVSLVIAARLLEMAALT